MSAGTPSCYLDFLDKLQKWICRTIGPSLAASLESLVLRQNATSLILINRYYFYRCSPALIKLVPLPHHRGMPTRYYDVSRYYKNVYTNFFSFFPRTARL